MTRNPAACDHNYSLLPRLARSRLLPLLSVSSFLRLYLPPHLKPDNLAILLLQIATSRPAARSLCAAPHRSDMHIAIFERLLNEICESCEQGHPNTNLRREIYRPNATCGVSQECAELLSWPAMSAPEPSPPCPHRALPRTQPGTPHSALTVPPFLPTPRVCPLLTAAREWSHS